MNYRDFYGGNCPGNKVNWAMANRDECRACKSRLRQVLKDTDERLARFKGCLIGLAAGDAVGTTVEFKPKGTFKPVTDMVGGGVFRLQAGEWTDDTSMALCIAESITTQGGFVAEDIMDNFEKWCDDGYMSVKGYCFDIGGATIQSLNRYNYTRDPFVGREFPNAAGNGALMRLAPVPMMASSLQEAMDLSGLSSEMTHGALQSIHACRYYGGLIWQALNGATKGELRSWSPDYGMHPDVQRIVNGDLSDPCGNGYVVDSMRAALWSFFSTESFEEGCLKVVNLGDDADTTGAIYGMLAGAFYGIHGIPEDWVAKIAFLPIIDDYAEALHSLNTLGAERRAPSLPRFGSPA